VSRFDVVLRELVSELSRLVGHPVELLRMTFPSGAPACLLRPVDRALRQGAFWRVVRASPSAGIWHTPEEALIGFASSVRGWRAAAASTAPHDLENTLRDRLNGGPVPAATLLADFAEQGVSRDRVGRAARRIGIVRQKMGMGGGWMWSLPTDSSSRIDDCAEATGGEVIA
jgi:hypothetical protein